VTGVSNNVQTMFGPARPNGIGAIWIIGFKKNDNGLTTLTSWRAIKAVPAAMSQGAKSPRKGGEAKMYNHVGTLKTREKKKFT